MNIKQTMRNLVLGALVVLSVLVSSGLAFTGEVNAKGNNGCETNTAIISCENVDTDKPGVENTGIWSILLTIINFMTAGVGVLALAGFVYGAILYTSAGGNPEQVKKARTVFVNVVIGIIAFGLMFALLNFIIPGGVFKT